MRIASLSLTTLLALSAAAVAPVAAGSTAAGDNGEGRLRQGRRRRELTANRRQLQQSRRSLLLEDYEVETNLENLKQQYYDFHGKELTDDMIEDALEKAHHDAGGKAFGPDRKIHMYGSVSDFDPADTPPNVIYMDDIEPDHPDYHHRHLLTHRRTQVVRRQNMYIVAGNSPGWVNNRGRNEFYCVSLYSLDRQNYLPYMGDEVTLRNCYTTPGKAIALRYANDFTIRTLNDNIYYTWCVRVDKPKKNQEATIDTCNFFDPNEVWNLFVADYTWRPGENADLDLCMTSQNNPSDGGKLQLEMCEEQYNFPNSDDRRLELEGTSQEEVEAKNALAVAVHDHQDQQADVPQDSAVAVAGTERDLGRRRKRRKNNRNNKKGKYNKRWYNGSNALRMRQVWITCAETDSCQLNVDGFLDCNLVTACQPGDPLP